MKLTTQAALLIAVLPLTASLVSAQYRVDNSAARDANNRLGSGGYNDLGANTRVGGTAGNLVVTGNVTDAKSFRGSLGYTAPSAFRGQVGSGSFDNFLRDTNSVSALRGGYGRENMATLQPYFGPGQTVSAPAGTVRDITRGGGYVPQVYQGIQPGDARLDLGGASRAQVAQSYLANQRTVGGAGLAALDTTNWANAAPGSGPIQLSAYTQLSRAPMSVYGANNAAGLPTNVIPANGLAAGAPNGAVNTAGSIDDRNAPANGGLNGPLNAGPGDLRVGGNLNSNLNGVRSAADRNADNDRSLSPADPSKADEREGASLVDPTRPGYTGQGSAVRSLKAIQNNPQYAELRSRFESRQRKTLDGKETVADATRSPTEPPVPGQRLDGRGDVNAGQRADDRLQSARPTDPRLDPTKAAQAGDEAKSPASVVPGIEVTPTTPSAQKPVADTLKLPRPEGDPAGGAVAKAPERVDRTPLLITSLATGVKDASLAQLLAEAEGQMQAGKFGSAIDAYGRAEAIAEDDPLVFMGRGIAELGGSYYRKAEVHLRQAYAGDESLLGAKFDLRKLLTDERLNFLTKDLGDVAKTNPNDAGPLVLLAFIYYNGGMEDRAARALEMAQERARGNDTLVKQLQANWQLATTEPTPAGDLNK